MKNMDDDKNKDQDSSKSNLEEDKPTDLQKKIEDKIAKDEETLKGEALSGELSKDRTHMSEHRTKMSEHRTGLSEHRTDLSEHRTGLSEHRTKLSEHRTNLSEKRTGWSEHRTKLSENRTDLSNKRTLLSYQRTALSYERTLMSWIRTAVSLISFGFTIYKVFEEIQQGETRPHIFTPRLVGISMIVFGFLGLLFAQIQHYRAYNKIKADYPDIQKSLSSVLGVLILIFGFLLFLAAIFRQ